MKYDKDRQKNAEEDFAVPILIRQHLLNVRVHLTLLS